MQIYNNSKKLDAKLARMQRRALRETRGMGREAVKHFKKSFDDKGFTDRSRGRWKPRSDRRSHPLMVKSGNLKGSIYYRVNGKHSVKVKVGQRAKKYASIHNKGLTIGGIFRGSGKKMPKRQFIGHSYQLNKKVRGNLKMVFEA